MVNIRHIVKKMLRATCVWLGFLPLHSAFRILCESNSIFVEVLEVLERSGRLTGRIFPNEPYYPGVTKVAVKMLKSYHSSSELSDLLSEYSLLKEVHFIFFTLPFSYLFCISLPNSSPTLFLLVAEILDFWHGQFLE